MADSRSGTDEIHPLIADGRILVEKLSPLIYARGEYWSVGEKLGTHGYSRREG